MSMNNYLTSAYLGVTLNNMKTKILIFVFAAALVVTSCTFDFGVYPAPVNGQAATAVTSWQWEEVAVAGKTYNVGVKHPAQTSNRTIVLVHGSEGFVVGGTTIADKWVAAGWNVVVGCWSEREIQLPGYSLPCPKAMMFEGQTVKAVDVVDGIVEHVKSMSWVDKNHLVIAGFSRGAALVALRGERPGRNEPIVLMSGYLSYIDNGAWPRQNELFPIKYVNALHAPVWMTYSEDDEVISPGQSTWFAGALMNIGIPPVVVSQPTGGHGGPYDQSHAQDTINAVTQWESTL